MSVGFCITFIGLLTHRYIEQTPKILKDLSKKGEMSSFLDDNKKSVQRRTGQTNDGRKRR
jgi:hypothetical protein